MLDDPVVWVIIIGIVIFLFGAGRIPKLARSLGQAKREFEEGKKLLNSSVEGENN